LQKEFKKCKDAHTHLVGEAGKIIVICYVPEILIAAQRVHIALADDGIFVDCVFMV